jgi:uncharacterized coiled-coil DUF342 family protein
MADRDLLERIDAHMARGNELMAEIREEHRLNRREHRLGRAERRLNRAAIQEFRQVMREVVLDMRENRRILQRIEQGIHAQTEGLLHVLDELRGHGGCDPAAT